jgi:hypothetical protein
MEIISHQDPIFHTEDSRAIVMYWDEKRNGDFKINQKLSTLVHFPCSGCFIIITSISGQFPHSILSTFEHSNRPEKERTLDLKDPRHLPDCCPFCRCCTCLRPAESPPLSRLRSSSTCLRFRFLNRARFPPPPIGDFLPPPICDFVTPPISLTPPLSLFQTSFPSTSACLPVKSRLFFVILQ